ncbi:MAG: 3-phosphoshikimate 1-carboxyvinyltransferase [Candidatus Omnitrophota bacterium]
MRGVFIRPISSLKGSVNLAGDKSIAHRALLISAISPGQTKISNVPANKDCLATLNVIRKLGIKFKQKSFDTQNRAKEIIIYGRGLTGLKKPRGTIMCGESGTTLRLLLGILAGQPFKAKISAVAALLDRPMLRVNLPLRLMGAHINARRITPNTQEEYPPIVIEGGRLKGITYTMPVASAQVKSAILLAGLYACGETHVIEQIKTRDHTERMLGLFKAKIKVVGNHIVIKGKRELVTPRQVYVPGDISSASFFLALGILAENSKINIKSVSLNPSRLGIIRVLKRMGADIKVTKSQGHKATGEEPTGDLTVKSSPLRGTVITKKEIPSLIDEIPLLMVVASLAKGETVFEGVGELRFKETDRIKSMSENLKKMGVKIKVISPRGSENIVISGIKRLYAARVRSFHDHRTAMSMVVAASLANGTTYIDDVGCIAKSFPGFLPLLHSLRRKSL